MSIRFSITVILACLTVASCASAPRQGYEGPPLADNDTALIKIRNAETVVETSTVDTLAMGSVSRSRFVTMHVSNVNYMDLRPANQVRVVPGDHCITLQVQEPPVGAPFRDWILCLTVVAGRTYEVRFNVPVSQPLRIWLADVESGEMVSRGVRGPAS
jgi:hypothetical protein